MRLLTLILTIFIVGVAFGMPERDKALIDPVTLLPNPGFEVGKRGMSITGAGTLAIDKATPGHGLASLTWDASATGEFLRTVLVPVPEGLKGRKCEVSFDYKFSGGTSGHLTYVVDDGTTDQFTPINLEPTTAWAPAKMWFSCPSSGSLRLEIASTANAALVALDQVHLGKFKSIDVAQTELVATAFYNNVAGCSWDRDNTNYGPFTANANCQSIIVVASSVEVDTTDNNLPDIVFPELTPGRYEITANLNVSQSTPETHVKAVAIFDELGGRGGECGNTYLASASAGKRDAITCSMTIDITTTTAKTFSIYGFESGAGLMTINNTSGGQELYWTVKKYPLASAEAVTLETTGWHVDANIGGANAALSTGTVSTYSSIVNAGLDMVVNSAKGSQSAEIPCSGGNESSGLTCSAGSEVVGASFSIPTTGRYKMCMSFSHFGSIAVSSNSDNTFQLIEHTNNLSGALQEGGARIEVLLSQGSGGPVALQESKGFNLCSNFNFSTVGKKTILLMYEHAFTGTVNSNLLLADRAATVGQRDIHITVEKMDQQFPTPVFTDLKNSLGSKPTMGTDEKMCRFTLAMATNTISNDSGCIQSVTHNSTGNDSVVFDSGFWTVAPKCIAAAGVGNGDVHAYTCGVAINPLTSIATLNGHNINSAGTGVSFFDTTCDVVCFGK